MNASTAAPVQKVAAGGIAGAIVTVVVFCITTFAHVDIPESVAAAAVLIVSFGVSYLVPAKAGEYPIATPSPSPAPQPLQEQPSSPVQQTAPTGDSGTPNIPA